MLCSFNVIYKLVSLFTKPFVNLFKVQQISKKEVYWWIGRPRFYFKNKLIQNDSNGIFSERERERMRPHTKQETMSSGKILKKSSLCHSYVI